jgi:hypothetical protein
MWLVPQSNANASLSTPSLTGLNGLNSSSGQSKRSSMSKRLW